VTLGEADLDPGVSVAASYSIRVSTHDGVAQVHLAGEVDLAAKPDVRLRVSGVLDDPGVTSVTVDLSDVSFLDSSGIGMLIGCKRMADESGKSLYVIGAQGQVANVLDLTGVGPLLAAPPI
jgi:anti-sigma B factor antagonist